MMKSLILIPVILLLALLAACATATETSLPEATPGTLANPASENCVAQGGTLVIAEDGSGGQYGICYFEDNRQCEEWALLRGDCPVGGLKITGYITPAAQYCAITGGTYSATADLGSANEQGTCTFVDGSSCDVWEYWYATCSLGQAAASAQGLANPASENCVALGGTLSIAEGGDGGQYGICYFEDNRQCEEWALLRGDCPVGGLKITGYITPAGQYCAITGGTYAITAAGEPDSEQGTCTFKDGSVCDAWDYYNGKCAQQAAAGEWVSYTNAEAGFSLQMPSNWSHGVLPDQNEGAVHGEAFNGSEGGVEVYWGEGLGGACPTETVPVQLAQAEVQACYGTNPDGTEYWSQMGYRVSGGNDFSTVAYTKDTPSSRRDLVMEVLATLTFMLPETTGATIVPLTMEVCDGQAQAMAHALDVLEVTQSEAPLSDPVTGNAGTGCMSTVLGTGADFESPDVVATALGQMLQEQGYTEDMLLAAGGPTGIGTGYRNGDQICLAAATWLPDETANCSQDEPISACMVAPEQQNYTITLNCGVENPQAQAGVEAAPTGPVGGGSGWLVFDSTRDGVHRDLYGLDIASGAITRLTQGELDNFAGPWSPDGLRIVFTSYGLTNSRIAEINADGSGEQTLSEIDGSDEGFPAWSPDGARIAFTSRRDGNNEIYLMNSDGSDPLRLTDAPGDDFAPSWSPDGTQLVFVSDRDNEPGIYDLYLMNADGSKLRRLTSDTANDYSPAWSPDGQWIVYRSHHAGAADIYLVKVDGSALHQLTDDPAEDWAPVWSPDGTRIAFQTNRDGNWEIYYMTVDGSNPINLTNDPADDQLPFWQP